MLIQHQVVASAVELFVGEGRRFLSVDFYDGVAYRLPVLQCLLVIKSGVSHAIVARIDGPLLMTTKLVTLIGGAAARPILVSVPIHTTMTVVAGVA